MHPENENSASTNLPSPESEPYVPDLNPQWEVIDKGGVPRLPGAFGDSFEVVEATETSAPAAPSQHQPNPVASPPGFETTLPPAGDDDLDATQPSSDGSLPHQARSRPDFETRPPPVGYEELTSPPETDEPLPTPAPRRKAKRCSVPRPRWDVQLKVPQRFTQILAERIATGTEFSLSDHTSFASSIQRKGERIPARAVRCMLINIQLAYYSQGLPCGRARVRRVEHLAIRFCEMLAIQDLAYPGVPLHDFMAEAFMALFNIQDGLEHLVSVREE